MPQNGTDDLTPAERRREVARILAGGLLRYRRSRLASSDAASESDQKRLDDAGQSRLHASTRSAGERAGDRETAGEVGRDE
jgi:hypothetical protein